MKKKVLLFFCLTATVLAATSFVLTKSFKTYYFYLMNVEVLSACENHSGFCREESGDCMGYCPICGELIWADGHKGPAYGLSGNCTGHKTE